MVAFNGQQVCGCVGGRCGGGGGGSSSSSGGDSGGDGSIVVGMVVEWGGGYRGEGCYQWLNY